MKVAVIGSGIAGLTAAWALGARHDVTVFERHRKPGMAAHAIAVGDAIVDVPLRVFYAGYYPTLLGTYDEVGVATEAVDYSGSFTAPGAGTYFRYENLMVAGTSLPILRGSAMFGRRSLRIVRDLLRFVAFARRDLRRGLTDDVTIVEYLWGRDLSSDFIDGFVLPTYAAICTCTYDAVRMYPARVIVDYLTRGLLFGGVRRAVHGATDVVDRFLRHVHDVRCDVETEEVRRMPGGVEVLAAGKRERFDHVVFATQANQVGPLLSDASDRERRVLGSFAYEPSRVVVHRDSTLAPRRRTDWAPVNFWVDRATDAPSATIWMNAVQPDLANDPPVFQTWNPVVEPNPGSVIAAADFERPTVSLETAGHVRALEGLHAQPDRRVWFCGSYAGFGIPLLESASRSARVVADLVSSAAV